MPNRTFGTLWRCLTAPSDGPRAVLVSSSHETDDQWDDFVSLKLLWLGLFQLQAACCLRTDIGRCAGLIQHDPFRPVPFSAARRVQRIDSSCREGSFSAYPADGRDMQVPRSHSAEVSLGGGTVDPDLAGLTSVAAAEVVKLLTTDVWERARTAVGTLWRRARPDRADAIESDLAEARSELLAAQQVGDKQVEQLLLAEWQGRLWRLLNTNPELARDLSRMVWEELRPPGESVRAQSISMDAEVSGGGSVYQAGRDQTITGGMNQREGPRAG
jgi:hypothetical protein